MSTTFRTLLSAGLTASLLAFTGCTGDDTGDSETDPTATMTNPTTTMSTGTATDPSGTDTDPTDGTGSTTDDPTAGGGGFCALGCSEDADCCPAGSMDCPGDAYPNNWSCNAGFCEFGGCANNDECTFGGALPDFECHELGGVGGCVDPCESDDDCAAIPDATCSFEYDDGVKGCAVPVDGGGCTEDADCNGFGVCNASTGACECTGDAECTTDGYVCKS